MRKLLTAITISRFWNCKILFSILLSTWLAPASLVAQKFFDSLQRSYDNAKDDTSRIRALAEITFYYVTLSPDILIRDNGLGISDKVKDKIFQPFFSTKPTGQGTGLGLSIAYDIIVKEHRGQIDFISEEGQYAECSILLPVA
jgi:K+-sensing histidine kinase KdpD